uniref:hypothetical protein n=1 Tax=Brevundimonas sp. TaxID=1871086 RepID=UPI002FCBECA0
EEIASDGDYLGRDSRRAGGGYRVTGSAVHAVENLEMHQKARLTTWLVDQRSIGVDVPVINTAVVEQVQLRKNLTVGQRKDRFFLALSRLPLGLKMRMKIRGNVEQNYIYWRNYLAVWTEAIYSDTSDVNALLELLSQDGFIEQSGDYALLTSSGWDRLDGTRIGGSDSLQVFVAMWFHQSTDEVYTNGIALAIKDAGYEPFRIDAKEHNNKIDDEIIAEIRRSRFLVSDFTSEVLVADGVSHHVPRGGVYYEAGFARGLGMEVISCVRADQISLVHFDTRQISHVLWTDPPELREKLYNRIVATLGEAPNAPGRGNA